MAIEECEKATDDRLAIRLDCHRINRIIRTLPGGEGRIKASIAIQAGDPISRNLSVSMKLSSDVNLAIGQWHNDFNCVVGTSPRGKCAIQRSVLIESRDSAASRPVDVC